MYMEPATWQNSTNNISDLPKYAPNNYVLAEIGSSQQKYRDVIAKLKMLNHVLNNTVQLRNMVLAQWNTQKTGWISVCKQYLVDYGLLCLLHMFNKTAVSYMSPQ